MSEPGAGSDLQGGVRTRAEKSGLEWVINGTKMWCTNASIAEYILTLARTNLLRGGVGPLIKAMAKLQSQSTSNPCSIAQAAAIIPAQGAQTGAGVPNFAPDSTTGWLKPPGDEFIQPESGPGPMLDMPGRPRIGNNLDLGQPIFPMADLNNPILQPWAREELRKANARALSGKAAYTPKERCWPIGTPGFLLYPVFPIYFIQTPKEVVMIWAEDHQVRRIYMNVAHSAKVTPSWFGESVGHYEGDTLVVDTIGLSPKAVIDNYHTPHTEALHVVERYRVIEDGKKLEVALTVDDPGAFNAPWKAVQLYDRTMRGPQPEQICSENNTDPFQLKGFAPPPSDDTPDF